LHNSVGGRERCHYLPTLGDGTSRANAQQHVPELYPYFRFLGAEWTEEHEEFVKKFGRLTKVR